MLSEGADDAAVLLAHNHPSGNLEPSSADVQVTRQLKAAGETLAAPAVAAPLTDAETPDGPTTGQPDRIELPA